MVAFLDRVLTCFGTPTEVLTGQGREFLVAFEEVCIKSLIYYHTTLWDYPEADGLAE